MRNKIMKNGEEDKIFGIITENLCKKASQNIGALAILSRQLNEAQKS